MKAKTATSDSLAVLCVRVQKQGSSMLPLAYGLLHTGWAAVQKVMQETCVQRNGTSRHCQVAESFAIAAALQRIIKSLPSAIWHACLALLLLTQTPTLPSCLAAGRGGPLVDEKRVIDLSAHRMQQLTR